MKITICIGSACHVKGSGKIVEQLKNLIAEHGIENNVELAGSFCFGVCNREGVTVQIDETVHTGIVPDAFESFFNENILAKL